MTILLPIILPFCGALVIIAARALPRSWHDAALLGSLFASGGAVLALFKRTASLGMTVFQPAEHVPGLASLWLADGLSLFLLLAIALLAVIVVMFMTGEPSAPDVPVRYALTATMVGAVNGALLSADLFSLYLFIELAVICAYALTAASADTRAFEAAFKYAVLGTVSSLALLCACGLIYAGTGTLSFHQIAGSWHAQDRFLTVLVLGLVIVGFGLKAGLVPFAPWLPDAYEAAPASTTALFSGAVSKAAGIYALVRVVFNVLGPDPAVLSLLIWLGAVSLLVGVTLALYQWRLRRLLAYHSISQIGYIVIGLSLGTPLGIAGGLLHLINHSAFKPLLFLVAGALERSTGVRSLREMGGLRQRMPVTNAASMIGALAISGVPPFNGFWSKLLIVLACLQADRPFLALLAVVGSILTLSSFLKVQRYAFGGFARDVFSAVEDAPLAQRFAMLLLAACCLGMGLLLLPGLDEAYLRPAVAAVMGAQGHLARIEGLLP